MVAALAVMVVLVVVVELTTQTAVQETKVDIHP